MPIIPLTVLDVFLACAAAYLSVKWISRSSKDTSLCAPGPKGLPFIGNILDMPTSQEWKAFADMGKRYGPIIHLNALGQHMIILNSFEISIEMLDRKSTVYSDRPVLPFVSELVGWKYTLALTPYGERFRDYRRKLHSVIGTRSNTAKFNSIMERESHRFLRRVLNTPDSVAEHIRWTAGAIILRISYGYQVKDHDDPFVTNADIAVDQFSKGTQVGAFLVDILPALKLVPGWFPGAQWKQTAKTWAKGLYVMVEEPYAFVKSQMAAGTASPSFVSSYLEENLTPEQEFNVKWAAASLYSGGADTTVSAVYTFFLAMTLHPEAQRKAQAELDAVIGHDRLPTFADRESLPYVCALVLEVLRWQPVVPLCLAHRTTEDDMQEGYFIPRGSLVIANIWQFLHDEERYCNPMTFNPDRFLSKMSEPDPRSIVFGFGRRICPGMNLADASVFMSCAMALAVFDISKIVENGVAVEPVVEYTSGTISHPKPFKCSIKPRSSKAASLITSDSLFEDA